MQADTMYGESTDPVRSPLLKWSAVFGGLVLGLAMLMLLSALWLALAYGSEMSAIRGRTACRSCSRPGSADP